MYAKHIWLQLFVCEQRNVDWRSIRFITLKSPREDRVFGYDALALDDANLCTRFNFLLTRFVEPGNHSPSV